MSLRISKGRDYCFITVIIESHELMRMSTLLKDIVQGAGELSKSSVRNTRPINHHDQFRYILRCQRKCTGSKIHT